MTVKRLLILNQINGVSTGSTATIALPVGQRRYHSISLALKLGNAGGATEANMASFITEIRMNLDGVTQRKFSAQELFNLNRQKGKSPTVATGVTIPGYLTMLLTEPQRRTIVERELTAWGMKNVGSFQIEVDIAAGATTPALSGFAIIDDVDEPPQGIVKWKKEIIQVSATGDLTYKLDTLRGDAYQSVTFIEGTAGDIDAIKVTWDGIQMYQDDENFTVELLNQSDFTKVARYRHVPLSQNSPQNAVPSIVRDEQGNLRKVGEFIATLTMGAAANVTIIREVVGLPD